MKIAEVSERYGLSADTLRYYERIGLLPLVTAPIVGATKISHLEDAVAALPVRLSQEEMNCLEEPYKPHPIVGHQ